MKQKRNKRLNDILAEFGNFGNMASINEDLILRHQRKLTGTEPSNDAFTVKLCAIFSSDADPLPDVGASPGPTPVFGIRQFSCAEMQGAIQNAGGRGAHGGSLMLELFKHDPPCLHVRFLFTMI